MPDMRILFVRVGWHTTYCGPLNDDGWPKGAGESEVNLHHEAFNFFDLGGTFYGTFGMNRRHLHLRKIDPQTLPNDPESVDGVLVVFVAACREDGQRIVGWYRDATVHDNSERVAYPEDVKRQIQNHFETNGIKDPVIDTFNNYLLSAKTCISLSVDERERSPEIPHDAGGFGRSNVCYPYDENHELKTSPWIKHAIDYIAARQNRRRRGHHPERLPGGDTSGQDF